MYKPARKPSPRTTFALLVYLAGSLTPIAVNVPGVDSQDARDRFERMYGLDCTQYLVATA